MEIRTDFYLASSEGYDLESPRNCRILDFLNGPNPNGYLLVSITPPIIGQQFGLGDKDIDQVILVSRHKDILTYPIKIWPAYVHVARPLSSFEANKPVREKDIELIAWAELYPTYEYALNKRR